MAVSRFWLAVYEPDTTSAAKDIGDHQYGEIHAQSGFSLRKAVEKLLGALFGQDLQIDGLDLACGEVGLSMLELLEIFIDQLAWLASGQLIVLSENLPPESLQIDFGFLRQFLGQRNVGFSSGGGSEKESVGDQSAEQQKGLRRGKLQIGLGELESQNGRGAAQRTAIDANGGAWSRCCRCDGGRLSR